jgi:hypothetical protein
MQRTLQYVLQISLCNNPPTHKRRKAMPTGVKLKNYPLIESKNKEEVQRAKSNIKWYARWKKGLTPNSPYKKSKRKKQTTNGMKSKIKKAGLDIGEAKKICRKEINQARDLYKALTDQYKDLVALEKLMKETIRRR